ncbi:DUF5305 family protein [Actinoplanes ianthinogenes]|uniref:DUF5305 family protein n=1 Tax=Actinoplanes ianthinogenes TaxID=122358 RepID=UPI001E5FF5C3|nr:DUF5305 family protein [Actinoplanes ianthinogenes]
MYYAGDLVVVAKSDSYEVGQIAAYHGGGGRVEVLHRIIGGNAVTGYVFKGDNNPNIDGVNPTADQLIGRAVVHIPKGGIWLKPVLSPTGLGMLGFLVVSGGTAAAKTRRGIPRGSRKKRAKGMAGGGGSWAAAVVVVKAVSRLHPGLRLLALLTAMFVGIGLILGVLGWMKPATQSTPSRLAAGESMTFSYSAKVKPSAAYDGTVAYSPDPIYRSLADFVDLQLQYRGDPGRININARLSSAAGWHSTMQLSQARQFSAERYTSTVLLDLGGIEDRVQDAAKAIGADLGQITIVVTAHVEHSDGTVFEPQLSLAFSQLQLALTNGPESLVVDESGKTTGGGVYPRQISVLGRDLMTAAAARTYAIRLLLIAVVGIIGIGLTALRSVPLATRAQIQRRYGHLLVPIEPVGKQSEPVVTVATFPALVKLAEKYGQMILTWTRPDGADDFVVRDDGVVYRFRIVPARPAAAKPPLSGMPHPARRAQKSAALGIASVINTPGPAAEASADKVKPVKEAAAHKADQGEASPAAEATEAEVQEETAHVPEIAQVRPPELADQKPTREPSSDLGSAAGQADEVPIPEPDQQPKPTLALVGRTAKPERATEVSPVPEENAGETTAARSAEDQSAAVAEETVAAEVTTEAEAPAEPETATQAEVEAEPGTAIPEEDGTGPESTTQAEGEAEAATPVKEKTEPEAAAQAKDETEPEAAAQAKDETEPEAAVQAKDEPEQEAAVQAEKKAEPDAAITENEAEPESIPEPGEAPKAAGTARKATTSTRAKTPRKAAPAKAATAQEHAAAPESSETEGGATERPARRSPRRRQKVAPEAEPVEDAPSGTPAVELRAAAPDVPKEDVAESAANSDAEPAKTAPRKRAASRKPRARKAAAPEAGAQPQAKADNETTVGPGPKAETAKTTGTTIPEAAEPVAETTETTGTESRTAETPEAKGDTEAAEGKSAQDMAAERKAAEELAERNQALEQAITRKAERDQAAADRARKQRLARAAPRDPVYDFLPRPKRPEQD